jgi:hypothetical protein
MVKIQHQKITASTFRAIESFCKPNALKMKNEN